MFLKKRQFLLGIGLLGLLLVSGCGGKTVPLGYTAIGPAAYPAPGAPTVLLVELHDQRPDTTTIGTSKDGTAFVPAGSVSDWVSRALADELTRQGLLVTYSSQPLTDTAEMPVVSGDITSLSLTENHLLNYDAQIAITLKITGRHGQLLSTESFRANQSATSLPTEANKRDLLEDTLRDVVAPAAVKIKSLLMKQ